MTQFVPIGTPVKTGGWTAYTAAQPVPQVAPPAAPTQSLQDRSTAIASPPSPRSPSAHAVQAIVNRQAGPAQNSLLPIPQPPYRDLDHWKQCVTDMVQKKKADHRLAYTPGEKVALVSLYRAMKSRQPLLQLSEFQNDIMKSSGSHIIRKFVQQVDQMAEEGVLPAPWQPEP